VVVFCDLSSSSIVPLLVFDCDEVSLDARLQAQLCFELVGFVRTSCHGIHHNLHIRIHHIHGKLQLQHWNQLWQWQIACYNGFPNIHSRILCRIHPHIHMKWNWKLVEREYAHICRIGCCCSVHRIRSFCNPLSVIHSLLTKPQCHNQEWDRLPLQQQLRFQVPETSCLCSNCIDKGGHSIHRIRILCIC